MFDDHETHEASDRSPKKVDTAIVDEHVGFSVDRAGRAGERGPVSCKVSQTEFRSVEFGASPSWDGRYQGRLVGDSRGPDPCDEVVSLLEQRQDDLLAGVVRVGYENGPRRNPFHQLEKERNHFVQQGGLVLALENHPFMDARGQGNRSDRTRSTPDQQRNGLERMPHDKGGFRDVVRALVEFLDRGHFLALLGDLDSIGKVDQIFAHAQGCEKPERQFHPQTRETFQFERIAMKEMQQSLVNSGLQRHSSDEAGDARQVCSHRKPDQDENQIDECAPPRASAL